MKILVTGAAGFIGSHTACQLLDRKDIVIGIDNLNNYYDLSLKKARLARLLKRDKFTFYNIDLKDRTEIQELFKTWRFDRIIHLAAQPGVRYSIKNPHAYIDSNLVGFLNILEGCRHTGVQHLTYASSSSVYGANRTYPFSIHDNVDHPLSLYAATKKANELMAHAYSNLYGLPTTGLRFFTVYGPWGRPDMAIFLFTKAIIENQPIDVYNNGDMRRDFTYINDIVEGVIRISDRNAQANSEWNGKAPDPGTSSSPWRVYNIGSSKPERVSHVIDVIEECLGKKAIRNLLPMQPGDVPETAANVDDLVRDFDFRPTTSIEVGIRRFVEWYYSYYKA